VLLQRAQLASPPTHRCRDRLHACRQRLCAHRRLAAGADLGRSALARRPASGPRSLCPAVLSRVRRLRAVLPLEPDAGRVRHRSGIPLASRPQTALSTAVPAGHPDRQSRTRGHLPRPQNHAPTRPTDRQWVRHPHRGHLRQASFWQILDQDLRQIRPRPAHRDHHQRRLHLQALPQGRTSAGPSKLRPCSRQKEHLQPHPPPPPPPPPAWDPPAATSNPSPVSTTSPPASERSTVSPNLVPSTAAPSEVSISSATPNRPCLPPCSVPPSTSPAFAAPISL